jgi:methyl-accepting chemotaxis protein
MTVMQALLASFRIGPRLAIALALPLLGLIVFSGLAILDSHRVSSDMHRVMVLADLAPAVSGVVHELQKERGNSAGYIGAKGGAFTAKLKAQTAETDVALTALQTALGSFPAEAYGVSLQRQLSEAQQALAKLTGARAGVVGLRTSMVDMATYYTGTIAELLDIVEEMPALSSHAGLSGRIAAYIAFLQAKERAGIERAMGANGFGAGAFAQPVYRRFVDLQGAQEAYFDTFRTFATADQREALAAVLKGDAATTVDRMRDVAVASAFDGGMDGVSGTAWFDTATARIDGLKTVEDGIADALVAEAHVLGSAATTTFWITLSVTLILLAATIALVLVIARSITRPIKALTAGMSVLAKGDKGVTIDGTERGDEVGEMSRAVQVFKDHMIENERMQAAQDRAQAEQVRRADRLSALTGAFDGAVGGVLETVAAATRELNATAESMSAIAEQTSSQATTVAAAAEEASTNVQTVASAAEQLSASIQEIGRQVHQSAEMSRRATDQARTTDQMVRGLSAAAQSIGEVVGLINDIADQTTLLALNATIEAARAGDAGKGFAVVANEVKTLANQTAKATGDIRRQIAAVQEETRGAADAIGEIVTTIAEVSDVAAAIAAAVEEQNAATQEISRNVQEAAGGTTEVTTTIQGVSQAAGEAGAASSEVLAATSQLSRDADGLRGLVQRFLEEVKTA